MEIVAYLAIIISMITSALYLIDGKEDVAIYFMLAAILNAIMV